MALWARPWLGVAASFSSLGVARPERSGAEPDPGPKGPRPSIAAKGPTRTGLGRGDSLSSHPSKSFMPEAKRLGRDPRFRPSKEGLHRQIIEATREGPAGRRLVSYGVAFYLEFLL